MFLIMVCVLFFSVSDTDMLGKKVFLLSCLTTLSEKTKDCTWLMPSPLKLDRFHIQFFKKLWTKVFWDCKTVQLDRGAGSIASHSVLSRTHRVEIS